MSDLHDTIARVAAEEGIDPAYALSVAERESSFNPRARASRTIAGLYQMRGDLRHKYGAGDSADPETQTRAFAAFTRDLRGQMASQLGRDPTNSETYLGHFWGGGRAARVLAGHHAGLAPSDVFSPYELAMNPSLARGRSAGGLASTIMGDLDRRQAKFGGNGGNSIGSGPVDFAQFGHTEAPDFSAFGMGDSPSNETEKINTAAVSPEKTGKTLQPERPGSEIDLAQFGLATGVKPPSGLSMQPEAPMQPGLVPNTA